MLAKRIIPCLDIKDGRTVKGVNFLGLKDAGDPVELAIQYALEGADELVFLDITATNEKRKTLVDIVTRIAENINIPFTVGGGITSVEDAYQILMAGADKIAVNSAAIKNPGLINELSLRFGNQCVVLAIDANEINENWIVHMGGGTIKTELDLFAWAKEGESRGAGEILFTSMNGDGTKKGFSVDALKQLKKELNIPVIASGGAGSIQDFKDVFHFSNVDAALAASVFHFGEINLQSLKSELKKENIAIR